MSTSDQQERGQLTRKQLREIRLTGSTPVITADETVAEQVPPASPAPPLPRPAKPVEVPPAPTPDRDVDLASAPLTRRQARAQERIRTASVPVVGAENPAGGAEADAVVADVPVADVPVSDVPAADSPVVGEAAAEAPVDRVPVDEAPTSQKAYVPAEAPVDEQPVVVEQQVDEQPLVAAPIFEPAAEDDDEDDDQHEAAQGVQPQRASDGIVAGIPEFWAGFPVVDPAVDADAERTDIDDDAVESGERPTVNSEFGRAVTGEGETPRPFSPSFDELLTVGDSAGSSHRASNALIFTPAPGEGSLSGPIAATGEVLVTGSYELPKGLGSQGHAEGVADGREVDAVLIDGELPPTSSPTPIAASSAISTLKPAGEVIRPPAPEKGNKLMLILAITAGGLALALGVALIFAFTTNVF